MNTQALVEFKKPSLFYRATSWLWPTNRDSLLWLCCCLVMLGLLDPIIEQQFFRSRVSGLRGYGLTWISVGAIGGSLLGLVATWAWRKLNPKAVKYILVASLFGFIALAYSTLLTWGNTKQTDLTGAMGRSSDVWPFFVSEGAYIRWAILAGVLAAAAMLTAGLIRGAQFCLLWLGAKKENGQSRRTKIMIAIALTMLVLGMIQNAFFPRGYLAEISISFSRGSATNQLLGGLGILFGGVLLICASWVFASGKAYFFKHLGLFLMLGFGCFLAFSYSVSSNYSAKESFNSQIAVTFAAIFALWTATVASTSSVQLQHSERPASTKWPCVWSLIAILFTLSFAVLFYFYDPVPVLATRDLDTARYSRQVTRNSGYQVRMGTFLGMGYGGFHDLNCNFENEVSPDVLGDFEVPGMAAASLTGLTPNVKTSVLTTLQSVKIYDSAVSSAQLIDLISATGHSILGNVEVIDPDQSVNLNGAYYTFKFSDGHRWDSLLKSIKSINPGCVISIGIGENKRLDRAEMDELVRLSQRVPLPLSHAILNQMIEMDYSSDLPMANLTLEDRLNRKPSLIADRLGQNYVLSRGISLAFGSRYGSVADDEELFWNLAFATGQKGAAKYTDKIGTKHLNSGGTLLKNVKKYGWGFGSNQKDELTHLFLPEAEIPLDTANLIGPFTSLETLCFDPEWLNSRHPDDMRMWGTPTVEKVSMTSVKSMSNLKRLVLSKKVEVTDPNFLTYIPKIEHLQVRFENSTAQRVDFSVCKQLKSLVYFGTPPKSLMNDLGTLQELESLVIVDFNDGTITSETAKKNLENYIPGLKTSVVLDTDFRAQPTEKFKKHAEKQAEVAREKIADSSTSK